MKISVCRIAFAVLVAGSLAGCETPPRHVSPGSFLAAGASPGAVYLGESEDNSVVQRADGAIVFTDTEDLPAEPQAEIEAAGKVYSGTGSKVRWH